MAGATVESRSQTGDETELVVTGMTCNNCARHVDEALRSVRGVQRAAVDLQNGQARVRWNPEVEQNPALLVAALKEAGYGGKLRDSTDGERSHGFGGWRFNLAFGLGVTVTLMVLEWGFGLGMNRTYQWVSFLLVLPVQIFCGWRFYTGAWGQLKVGQSNMDTLVALGSTTAFLYSVFGLFSGWAQHLYFMDAAAIITLVSAGHYLEEKMSVHAAASLRSLLNLAPETARKRTESGEVTVPIAALVRGDTIALRSGDRIPTDAELIEGTCSVDESMLTGESLPVEKSPGSKVFAGTLNESGSVICRVTGTGESTALARIIQIVEKAQSSRAQIQRLGDRVSSIFVPIVVLTAVATALWWGMAPASAGRAHEALSHFLWHSPSPDSPLAAAVFHFAAVLIIACPCAMGLATPIAIMAGTNAAARRGILIRDGIALEKTGNISAVIFDKTGTLTEGKVSVAGEEAYAEDGAAIAAGLASHSSHPLSKALAARSGTAWKLTDVREMRGAGLEATLGGTSLRLGSLRWLSENSVDIRKAAGFAEEWSKRGASLVGLGREKQLIAVFALNDRLKPRALEVVTRLQRSGYKIYLVSGDQRATAEAIGSQAGIPAQNVRAEVRPEGKVEFIQALQAAGEHVAFAGDGINDAPALQQADLGIALMNASDVARESADIVLLKADLEAIPEALTIAQRTLRTIKQNLFWAFFYNAAGIPLAALGFLSPVFSAFAMGMSDLIVVGNALRLRLSSAGHDRR